VALTGFTFDRPLTERFLELGYDLYRGDPRWIPPSRKGLAAQLSPAFPFYGRPGHEHRRFLATAGGRPVARALASVHPGLRDRDGTPLGAIGFFESDGDRPAAGEVLAAAAGWLRSRGLRRVWGPLNFDIWHGYRLMTRGFERPPFLGEPANKPCYPELFERAGFAVRRRWNSLELEGPEALDRLLAGGGDVPGLPAGYRVEPFAARPFPDVMARLHSVLVASFSSFLGFTEISLGEFGELMAPARPAVDRECSLLFYDDEGVLAGFTAVFLEVSEAVRAMAGRDSPAARLRFLLHRRRGARRAMLHLGGITPREAARRSGLAGAAFRLVLERLRARGCENLLATLIARGNPVRRLYREFAADERREYALYERNG